VSPYLHALDSSSSEGFLHLAFSQFYFEHGGGWLVGWETLEFKVPLVELNDNLRSWNLAGRESLPTLFHSCEV
jgi:hypothetical protein